MSVNRKLVLAGHFNTGDQTRNVFYILSGAATAIAHADADAYIDSIFHAGCKSGITANWTSDNLTLYQWIGGYWNFEDQWAKVIVGTAGGNPDAQQLAYVLVARTGIKRVVPKKFLAGVVPAAHNQGAIMPATLAALNTSAAAWITPWTSGGASQDPSTWTHLLAMTPLLAAHADPYLGTQRRRKQGVGF